MDHGLELISPILEILEIEVSNILHNPGNIGNLNLCFAVEPPRRGFFSARNNISLIFGHVQSQDIALFLDFGPYLAPIWLYVVLIEPY